MERIGGYTLLSELGVGSYGKVYYARNAMNQEFAIKKISIQTLNPKLNSLINTEIRVLNSVRNPSILMMHESILTKRFVYIVTEYCAGGDLELYLKTRSSVSIPLIRKWLKCLVQALIELKQQNIIHRDLKLANFMLTDKDPEKALIKIGDFGFAKFLGDNMTSTKLGTPLYMAPEIFSSEFYDHKVDVWSLGIVTYELLCGRPPYVCYQLQELIRLQQSPIVFDENMAVPVEAQQLVHAMTRYSPKDRIDYEEVLQMDFFKENPGKKAEESIEINENEYELLEDTDNEIVEVFTEESKAASDTNEVKDELIEQVESFKKSMLPEKFNSPTEKTAEKDIQSFSINIECQIQTVNLCLGLKPHFENAMEVVYCICLYSKRTFETILSQIKEINSKYPTNSLLNDTLDPYYQTLQLSLIDINENLNSIKKKYVGATEASDNTYLQNHLINAAFSTTNHQGINIPYYLFLIGSNLYPTNEVLAEGLWDCEIEKAKIQGKHS